LSEHEQISRCKLSNKMYMLKNTSHGNTYMSDIMVQCLTFPVHLGQVPWIVPWKLSVMKFPLSSRVP